MIWRWLVDHMNLKHAAQLARERSSRANDLRELKGLNDEMTVAIADMSEQARLGSYHRVRLPVRHR